MRRMLSDMSPKRKVFLDTGVFNQRYNQNIVAEHASLSLNHDKELRREKDAISYGKNHNIHNNVIKNNAKRQKSKT